jgi:hypothetical protein
LRSASSTATEASREKEGERGKGSGTDWEEGATGVLEGARGCDALCVQRCVPRTKIAHLARRRRGVRLQ